MFKFALIVTALLLPTLAGAADDNQTATVAATVSHNLPVIVRNEVIDFNLCRLSFENGTSINVGCTTNEKSHH